MKTTVDVSKLKYSNPRMSDLKPGKIEAKHCTDWDALMRYTQDLEAAIERLQAAIIELQTINNTAS